MVPEIVNRDRLDHHWICDNIESGSRVLDLGCGSGNLLVLLRDEKQVKGQGIELSEDAIYNCVENGISVNHMDFDSGLASYQDQSFDYVIMNQSLQEVVHAEFALEEAFRVGKNVIIGFPNFAHISSRFQLFFKGQTPVTNSLPHLWYNTPNLHFSSISDFEKFIKEHKYKFLKNFFYSNNTVIRFRPNLRALNAIFIVTRGHSCPK
jgi:methionine biosynthesis protein MetW